MLNVTIFPFKSVNAWFNTLYNFIACYAPGAFVSKPLECDLKKLLEVLCLGLVYVDMSKLCETGCLSRLFLL